MEDTSGFPVTRWLFFPEEVESLRAAGQAAVAAVATVDDAVAAHLEVLARASAAGGGAAPQAEREVLRAELAAVEVEIQKAHDARAASEEQWAASEAARASQGPVRLPAADALAPAAQPQARRAALAPGRPRQREALPAAADSKAAAKVPGRRRVELCN